MQGCPSPPWDFPVLLSHSWGTERACTVKHGEKMGILIVVKPNFQTLSMYQLVEPTFPRTGRT